VRKLIAIYVSLAAGASRLFLFTKAIKRIPDGMLEFTGGVLVAASF
jgi:zinc transporter ZupT